MPQAHVATKKNQLSKKVSKISLFLWKALHASS